MFKKTVMFLSFLLAVTFSYAQTKHKVTMLINTGFSIPGSIKGEFSEYLKSDLKFGCGIGIPINRKFTFFADVSYNGFHHDKKGILDNEEVSGDPVTQVSGGSAGITAVFGSLALKVNTRAPEGEFYITGGVGLLRLSIEDITLNGTGMSSLKETAPAILVGGLGFYDLTDDLIVFFSGKFVAGFTKGKTSYFIPLSIGLACRF
ncbi:hypothetical protein ACFL4T_11585 [candidate division KSB1 bacterium]